MAETFFLILNNQSEVGTSSNELTNQIAMEAVEVKIDVPSVIKYIPNNVLAIHDKI